MSTLRVFYDKWLASADAGGEDGDDSDAETRYAPPPQSSNFFPPMVECQPDLHAYGRYTHGRCEADILGCMYDVGLPKNNCHCPACLFLVGGFWCTHLQR